MYGMSRWNSEMCHWKSLIVPQKMWSSQIMQFEWRLAALQIRMNLNSQRTTHFTYFSEETCMLQSLSPRSWWMNNVSQLHPLYAPYTPEEAEIGYWLLAQLQPSYGWLRLQENGSWGTPGLRQFVGWEILWFYWDIMKIQPYLLLPTHVYDDVLWYLLTINGK